MIEEARRNLHDPAQLAELEKRLAKLETVSEGDPTLPCPIDISDKDRPVLMAALSASADYLLTGDKQHFERYFGKKVGALTICTPRDCLSKPRG